MKIQSTFEHNLDIVSMSTASSLSCHVSCSHFHTLGLIWFNMVWWYLDDQYFNSKAPLTHPQQFFGQVPDGESLPAHRNARAEPPARALEVWLQVKDLHHPVFVGPQIDRKVDSFRRILCPYKPTTRISWKWVPLSVWGPRYTLWFFLFSSATSSMDVQMLRENRWGTTSCKQGYAISGRASRRLTPPNSGASLLSASRFTESGLSSRTVSQKNVWEATGSTTLKTSSIPTNGLPTYPHILPCAKAKYNNVLKKIR